MSLTYIPTMVPEEYSAAMLEEELRRIQEVLTQMQAVFVEHVPQSAAPAHPQEGWVVNADGDNWNPGFGAGMYTYLNGRWEPMSGKDFLIEVNKGLVPGHSLIHKFGHNLAASTTEEDVWGNGGIMTFLQGAETMDVLSSDTVNDISTGGNARTVEIIGVDADFNVVTETVILGATAVTTNATFIRVYRMKVVSVGTYGVNNAGVITATATTAGTVQCDILAGNGQSGTSHYTVPTGFTAFIVRISITVDGAQACDFHLYAREDADVIAAPFAPVRAIHHWEGISQEGEDLKANHVLPAKTDVWFTCKMTGGSPGKVDVDYDILLIDNAYLT